MRRTQKNRVQHVAESSRAQSRGSVPAGSRRAGARARVSEAGEMLLELLMTTSIVTICVIGLVGALGSNFHFSAVSRQINNADQLLSRYAEALAAQTYEPCGSTTPYAQSAATSIPNSNLPSSVTVGIPGAVSNSPNAFALSVESVQYWNGDTQPATFTSTCPTPDRGVQRLVVLVAAGDASLDRRVTIVKRQP